MSMVFSTREFGLRVLMLIGVVSGLASTTAIAQLRAPSTVQESIDRLETIVERHQRPDSRDDPNAFVAFGQAIQVVRDVDRLHWLDKDFGVKNGKTPPDFDAIHMNVGYEVTPEAIDLAKRLVGEYEKAGLFELTAKIRSTRRAIRPRPGSEDCLRMRVIAGGETSNLNIEPLLLMPRPEIGKFRALVRIQGARFALSIERGDLASAALAFEETLALARMASYHPTVIDRNAANAAAMYSFDWAMDVLMMDDVPARWREELAQAIDRQLPLAPFQLTIEGEQLLVLDVLRYITVDGRPDYEKISKLTSKDGQSQGLPPGVIISTTVECERFAQQYFDRVMRLASRPRYTRRDLAEQYREEWKMEKFQNFITSIMVPQLERTLEMDDVLQLRIAGVRAVIAIENHRSQTKSYPRTLEEMGLKDLRTLQDPFSGELLRYKLLPVSAGERERYMVYSVANDGRDDGGKVATMPSDALQEAKAYEGFDFVLTPQSRLASDSR